MQLEFFMGKQKFSLQPKSRTHLEERSKNVFLPEMFSYLWPPCALCGSVYCCSYTAHKQQITIAAICICSAALYAQYW